MRFGVSFGRLVLFESRNTDSKDLPSTAVTADAAAPPSYATGSNATPVTAAAAANSDSGLSTSIPLTQTTAITRAGELKTQLNDKLLAQGAIRGQSSADAEP